MEPFTLRIRRIRGKKAEDCERSFPREVPVAFYVNSTLLATVAATPQDLEDLAMGFLFTERIIDGPSRVRDLSAAADGRRGQVWVTLGDGARLPSGPSVTSGCGRGISFLCASDLDGFPGVEGGGPFAPALIREAAEAMRRGAAAYRAGAGSTRRRACGGRASRRSRRTSDATTPWTRRWGRSFGGANRPAGRRC